jgi:glucosamine 6-phosphate synthetase-like amidotransferase/phosphosugar isomerase protein
MCGIFGQVSSSIVNRRHLKKLVKYSEQRGMDSSGLIYYDKPGYKV